jgi:hypothetical protein
MVGWGAATVSPTKVPPQVILVPPNATYCTSDTSTMPQNQLFYLNAKNKPALPTGGYVCINNRANSIPASVIDTNKSAHALIQSYSAANGVTNSVWQYYKLINVQYQPINKDHAGLSGTQPGETNFLNANNPSTYYLSNIGVETNRPLQLFSGGLVQGGSTGSNSDYDTQYGGTGIIHSDMFYQGSGYNMGGCMGCHGLQGQVQGGDFSVIVARGTVSAPEYPAPITSSGAAVIQRNRSLK